MRARVSFVSRTAKGGIATRDQDVEADVIRFGRSTDNEVYLADPRVPLHLAVLHERPSGTAVETPEGLRRLTTRVQPHERPMELFIEAIGAADLRHNGAVKRSCQVAVGDILALGPFDVTLVAPPEGCTAAFSVEMARPLGDDLQALQARSVTTVRATSTSKRAWAFGLGGVVLLLFLVIPVLGAVIPGVREASRGWAVATDTAWLPGALSRPHQLFGGDCGNCHVAAFTPVQDTACR
ncbi:MAG: hypothetical protein FJX56_10840, partial [Alphaproteobacteria bacterium]|nr:hypothetical protein [Alphaproteobacteria bacterium]